MSVLIYLLMQNTSNSTTYLDFKKTKNSYFLLLINFSFTFNLFILNTHTQLLEARRDLV